LKITNSKKIVVEDFGTKDRETVKRLAATLNPHLDQVAQALGTNLTLRDNFKAKVYAGITLAAGSSTYTCSWDLNEKPTAVLLGHLVKSTGDAPSAVFSMSWRYENKQIYLTFLGLNGATAYTATIVGLV